MSASVEMSLLAWSEMSDSIWAVSTPHLLNSSENVGENPGKPLIPRFYHHVHHSFFLHVLSIASANTSFRHNSSLNIHQRRKHVGDCFYPVSASSALAIWV